MDGGGWPVRMLVVWCPDWPVTAAGIDAATPGAVIGRSRVAACSAAARTAGVQRGQRVRDAQRHCPGLLLRDRDGDAEARLFEPVASALGAITPWVEVVRPGVCALPVRDGNRAGEEGFRVEAQDTVVELGFDCGAGIADGPFAAELAARAGDGGVVVPAGRAAAFLAPYPVAVLDRPELADLLPRLGIRTLGDFAALPARHVAERFGTDEIAAHRLARGLDERLPAPSRPHQDLTVTTGFDPPAGTADRVIFAAKALAERLHQALTGQGLICVRLGIEVTGADGEILTRLWRHGGELSALAVAERVRWQLTSWPTSSSNDSAPLRSGPDEGGVTRLTMIPDQLVADEGTQRGLWGEVTVGDRIGRAAARIQAMLGHGAITRPALGGGRGPAERVIRVPVGDVPPDDEAGGPWPGRVPNPAPAIVRPVPVEVTVSDAAGVPVAVSGRCAVSAPPAWLSIGDSGRRGVTGWTGPWPVRERWWDPGQARRQARFQFVTEDGVAHLLTVEGGRWLLEATYD